MKLKHDCYACKVAAIHAFHTYTACEVLQHTALVLLLLHSLTKLMVSHDLSCSMVTNQIVFDQRDLHSTPEFERMMDHRCHALVFKLET